MAATQEEINEKQKIRRRRMRNWDCKKYEKTKNGFLMRLYRNMQSRVEGVQWMKRHLYEGKHLLSREEFYAWAKPHPEFHRLFDAYEAAGFPRKLAPSPDRIDSSIGYTVENMEWVTMSVNSSRSHGNKKKVSP